MSNNKQKIDYEKVEIDKIDIDQFSFGEKFNAGELYSSSKTFEYNDKTLLLQVNGVELYQTVKPTAQKDGKITTSVSIKLDENSPILKKFDEISELVFEKAKNDKKFFKGIKDQNAIADLYENNFALLAKSYLSIHKKCLIDQTPCHFINGSMNMSIKGNDKPSDKASKEAKIKYLCEQNQYKDLWYSCEFVEMNYDTNEWIRIDVPHERFTSGSIVDLEFYPSHIYFMTGKWGIKWLLKSCALLLHKKPKYRVYRAPLPQERLEIYAKLAAEEKEKERIEEHEEHEEEENIKNDIPPKDTRPVIISTVPYGGNNHRRYNEESSDTIMENIEEQNTQIENIEEQNTQIENKVESKVEKQKRMMKTAEAVKNKKHRTSSSSEVNEKKKKIPSSPELSD